MVPLSPIGCEGNIRSDSEHHWPLVPSRRAISGKIDLKPVRARKVSTGPAPTISGGSSFFGILSLLRPFALPRSSGTNQLGFSYRWTFDLHCLIRPALFLDWLDPHGAPDFSRLINCVNHTNICQPFVS